MSIRYLTVFMFLYKQSFNAANNPSVLYRYKTNEYMNSKVDTLGIQGAYSFRPFFSDFFHAKFFNFDKPKTLFGVMLDITKQTLFLNANKQTNQQISHIYTYKFCIKCLIVKCDRAGIRHGWKNKNNL